MFKMTRAKIGAAGPLEGAPLERSIYGQCFKRALSWFNENFPKGLNLTPGNWAKLYQIGLPEPVTCLEWWFCDRFLPEEAEETRRDIMDEYLEIERQGNHNVYDEVAAEAFVAVAIAYGLMEG